MSNKNKRLGEHFINKEGYEFIIVEYNNANNIIIEFQDKNKARIPSRYDRCKNTSNPYHTTVYNIGCKGLMSDGSKPITSINGKITKEYKVWSSMIQRCYDENFHENNPTYKDCTICERWLVFANFLEDVKYIEGYELWKNNDGYALDKDLKGNGSKIYSLETCCFISIGNNAKERNDRCGSPSNGNNVKIYGINIKTGEKTKNYNSIREASRDFGVAYQSIQSCLNKKANSCKGYRWFKTEKNNDEE